MNLSQLKGLFLKILIGCLIASAGLAVVAILVGKVNSVFADALFTILLVALHSLVSFGFISNNEKQSTFNNLEFFTNTTFGLIVLSFCTSVLGTWGVLPGSLVFKLYCLYAVLLFAVLHGEVLAKTVGKQSNIDKVVYANYCFMAVVILMLLPVIFSNFDSSLGSFYYRLLGACGIVDATLTLTAIILHKLYLQKHPKINDTVYGALPLQMPGQPGAPMQAQAAAQPRRTMNFFVAVLIGYVAIQLFSGLLILALGAIR